MTELTLPIMDADDARRLTERIRITATNARESLTKLQGLVEEAQRGQAHVALGYKSWTAYLADVFGDAPMLLPKDERREVVQWLASEGMSTRDIAPVLGIGNATAHRDIVATVSNETVQRPSTVMSHDGRERPSTYTRPAPPPEPTPAAPEVIAPREFKPEPKPGTDLHTLRYVVIPALNAWADEWTNKTLLDNTVTAEEAAQLLRDLSRTTPVLSQIRRLLNSRIESSK